MSNFKKLNEMFIKQELNHVTKEFVKAKSAKCGLEFNMEHQQEGVAQSKPRH